MKRILLFLLVVCVLPLQALQAKLSFVVGGPENTYNRVVVVNETSQPEFRCRVVVMNEDNSTDQLIGIYKFSNVNDRDSNSKDVRKGMQLGIELPKDFAKELAYTIEYKDYPLYDAIVVHLYEKDSEFIEE